MPGHWATRLGGAVAVVLLSQAATADVIELRADYWCPFNCDPDSDRPGYMVEIMAEALAMHGHRINYQTTGWARSLEMARTGEINGVIGTDVDESPDFIFGPPTGRYQESAAFRIGEGQPFDTREAIEGLRVGGILGYDYIEAINEYIAEHTGDIAHVQLMTGDKGLERNLKKLLANRIDLVPEERSVLLYTLDVMGLRDQVEIVPDPEITDLYIGFSPALEISHHYAQDLRDGVARMRENGRYAEILARYGLTE